MTNLSAKQKLLLCLNLFLSLFFPIVLTCSSEKSVNKKKLIFTRVWIQRSRELIWFKESAALKAGSSLVKKKNGGKEGKKLNAERIGKQQEETARVM